MTELPDYTKHSLDIGLKRWAYTMMIAGIIQADTPIHAKISQKDCFVQIVDTKQLQQALSQTIYHNTGLINELNLIIGDNITNIEYDHLVDDPTFDQHQTLTIKLQLHTQKDIFYLLISIQYQCVEEKIQHASIRIYDSENILVKNEVQYNIIPSAQQIIDLYLNSNMLHNGLD